MSWCIIVCRALSEIALSIAEWYIVKDPMSRVANAHRRLSAYHDLACAVARLVDTRMPRSTISARDVFSYAS